MTLLPLNLKQLQVLIENENLTSIILFDYPENLSRVYAAYFKNERTHSLYFEEDITKQQIVSFLDEKGIFYDYGIDT